MAYKRISPQPVIEGGTGAITFTAHGALIGAGTGAITAAAPGAVSGKPLISQGSSADPVFGIAEVVGGGTGGTTWTAYSLIAAGTTSTGSFQNISGVGTADQVLTSNGAGTLPTWQSIPSGGITDIDGDTGTATGSTITFNAQSNAGSTVLFNASVATVDLIVTNVNDNTLIGANAGNGTLSGDGNTGLGSVTLNGLTNGSFNTALGQASLGSLTGGGSNAAVGYSSLFQLLTGTGNVALGENAGSAYTTSESGNILIGNGVNGTIGESNTIRIGDGQTSAYMAGIASVSVSNKEYVTIDTVTGKMGSDSGPTTFTWSVITANQTAAINNGYLCNKAGTLTLALPAVASVGSIIEVTNENTALGVQFTQAAGQQILIGSTNTTSGATGTLTSSAVGDTLKIVCKTANTIWRVTSEIGNWTPA